jgi:hypothetical protein
MASRLGALLAVGVGIAALTARPSFGSERGYEVWFAGQVLSVDAQGGRLRVARGPTETEGRGIEECVAAGAGLRFVRPGMHIEAQADTRHRPWRILHLRVMRRQNPPPGGAASQVALVRGPATLPR